MKHYKLDDQQIYSIVRQTAYAIGFMHKENVVHGNLKASNIIVSFFYFTIKIRFKIT